MVSGCSLFRFTYQKKKKKRITRKYHILYLNEDEHPGICTQHSGFTIMSGFSDNIYMFKSFLKNGGEIGPHHLMEAAITHKEEFQTLEGVD